MRESSAYTAPNLDCTANGFVALLQFGNGLSTQSTYDPLSFRLKQLQTGGLQNLPYRYDAIGNVLTVADTAMAIDGTDDNVWHSRPDNETADGM